MRDKTCSRNAQRKKPTGQVWWRIPHTRSFLLTWLTPKLVVPSSTTSPCMFTLTRLEAVISLYIIPGGKVVSNGVFYEMKIIVFWSINLFFTKRVEKKVLSVLADPCCHVVVYALQAIFVYALQTIFDTQPSGKTMPWRLNKQCAFRTWLQPLMWMSL